MIPKNLATRSV